MTTKHDISCEKSNSNKKLKKRKIKYQNKKIDQINWRKKNRKISERKRKRKQHK